MPSCVLQQSLIRKIQGIRGGRYRKLKGGSSGDPLSHQGSSVLGFLVLFGSLVEGQFLDPLLVARTLDDAVHINSRKMNFVWLEGSSGDDLFNLKVKGVDIREGSQR